MTTNKYVYPELKRLDKEVGGECYLDSNENLSSKRDHSPFTNTSDKSDSMSNNGEQSWRNRSKQNHKTKYRHWQHGS